ncbi:hypothetical protein FGO68_gene918 [Halteria grandinella]|uniref:Uncharacterized protein n=1 Tax=Halteria grandinella TaxID=5974 RepID=A0A8J8P5F5_HALGN|nr:hypothetical protein FGO68_gene918 [Halteria grandinella]
MKPILIYNIWPIQDYLDINWRDERQEETIQRKTRRKKLSLSLLSLKPNTFRYCDADYSLIITKYELIFIDDGHDLQQEVVQLIRHTLCR